MKFRWANYQAFTVLGTSELCGIKLYDIALWYLPILDAFTMGSRLYLGHEHALAAQKWAPNSQNEHKNGLKIEFYG